MILTFVFPTNMALAFLKPKDNDLLILVQSYIQTKLYFNKFTLSFKKYENKTDDKYSNDVLLRLTL